MKKIFRKISHFFRKSNKSQQALIIPNLKNWDDESLVVLDVMHEGLIPSKVRKFEPKL